MKTCTHCKQVKELRAFYKQEGRPMSRCQDCMREKANFHYRFVIRPRTLEKRRNQGVGLYGKPYAAASGTVAANG